MANRLSADKVSKQLSVRVDDDEMERIDEIRKNLHKSSGIMPQRSAVVRKVLTMGIDAYSEQLKVEKRPAAPVAKKKGQA